MASRAGYAGVLALIAYLLLGAAAAQPSSRTALYTVRVDPRLCPSPLCGGYFVALANSARTRCVDGLLHPRCYVARAVDTEGNALGSSIADGALVRGTIEPGRDDLGELVTAAVHAPAGTATLYGRYHRLVDTGIRCVRAPCFSTSATLLNRPRSTTTSGLVLNTLGERKDLEERVLAALATKNGVLARGRIVATRDGGRVFHASRFYLRSQS